jgi:hypothetical protein
VTSWERFFYLLFLAFWRAYFDILRMNKEAEDEVPDAKTIERTRRFRDAYLKLREAERNTGSDGNTSSS